MIPMRLRALRTSIRGWGLRALVLGFALSCVSVAGAGPLDEMALDRWAKLREVERYQLQIAEKYYREQNWKTAVGEYEKFMTLYEQSEGAPYCQLKWALCQVHLKKVNTAIKDGFQSVIDYWPDSPEAKSSAFLIGRSYKDIGETKKAKAALHDVVKKHEKQLVAALAMSELLEIAESEMDDKARVDLWKKLTFDFERNQHSAPTCVKASQQYATFNFYKGEFAEGARALETSYTVAQLPYHVWYFAHNPIAQMTGEEKSKTRGEKVSDQAAAYIKEKAPTDTSTPEKKKAARDAWFYAADVLAASRRAETVQQIYAQIVQKFGNDDDTFLRYGNFLKSQTKYDAARAEYAKFQNQIEGNNQIAYSFRQERKTDQAVAAYQRNVGADAQNAAKWFGEIATAYREVGKWNEALAVYQELVKSDTKNSDQWMWLMGITHRDAGQNKEAIGVFRQCNNFPSNYQEMAACHRRLKQYGEAVVLYGQIVSGSKPQAPWALLQIGFTQEEAGDKEKAIAAFQQVCKKFPTDGHASQAHAHLQTKYKLNVTLGGAKDD